MKSRARVVVAGGGLAGTMAALTLARMGVPVTLLEKSKGPHDKVCGEFLSVDAMRYLQEAGLDVEAMGGVPIRSVRLITRSFAQEAALPFSARSLTRRLLDEALLRLAAEAGAEVLRDAAVRSVTRKRDAWSVLLRDDREFSARDVVLATGKLDLNGWGRPEGIQTGLVGYKMYYRLHGEQQRKLGSAVELIPYRGGYTGLQQTGDGLANLCLLLDPTKLRTGHRQWADVLDHVVDSSPHLQERLHGATAMLDKPLTTSRLPYGHVQRTTQEGLWRVGDQAAVIPSFCGDGMAIALHSGALAATSIERGAGAPAYQRQLCSQLAGRVRGATRLSQILVELPMALRVVRMFPNLLRLIASGTRVPERALMAIGT